MDFVVPLQPTLGARASSPAIFAGEDARVPRQIAVITVSYIEVELESRDNELRIYITTFPAYLLELLPAAEAERSDGAGIADAPYEGLPQGEVGDEEIVCHGFKDLGSAIAVSIDGHLLRCYL